MSPYFIDALSVIRGIILFFFGCPQWSLRALVDIHNGQGSWRQFTSLFQAKVEIGTIKANTGPPTANAAIERNGLFLWRQKGRRQKKQAPSLESSRLVCRMAVPDQAHRGCPRLFKNYFHLLKKRERSLELPYAHRDANINDRVFLISEKNCVGNATVHQTYCHQARLPQRGTEKSRLSLREQNPSKETRQTAGITVLEKTKESTEPHTKILHWISLLKHFKCTRTVLKGIISH